MVDLGLNVLLTSEYADILTNKNNWLIMRAHWQSQMYHLQVKIWALNGTFATQDHTVPKAPLALWHRRLGHIDEDTICKMVCMDAVTGLKVDREGIQDCSACQKGKQTQNIIPHSTHERATEVLGQVFSDVCGPMENSTVEGYCYFITFTDDYSRYTHISFCKTKDDALEAFKTWKACTEKETGKKNLVH